MATELGRRADRVYGSLIPALRAEWTTINWLTDPALASSVYPGTWMPGRAMRRDPAIRGLLHDDIVAGLNYYERLIEAVRKPYWTAREMIARIEEDLRADGASFWRAGRRSLTLLLVPMNCGITEKFARFEARLSVMRLACAVEVYRIRRGRLPASLEELAPDILPELPRDPFTGRSYVYRVKPGGAGYLVYSVGSDGEDDGDVWSADPGIETDWDEGDIVFER